MPITTELRKEVETVLDAYCLHAIPEHARDQIRIGYGIEGMDVILFEERPKWDDDRIWMKHPVAKFRYVNKYDHWKLYCLDRNSKWHYFEPIPPVGRFKILLDEVEKDKTGIFWG